MTDQLTPTTTGAMHDGHGHDATWTDLAKEMWSYLTGQGAAINYSFVDMAVEVPRDTGPEAPRATWKLNGTLRITTEDQQHAGSGT
ncbi:hypothetical protein GCM10011509_05690 [Ornithinimicrobium pekingense]|uniref:Uncharacterized protein n=2 Tax=Ornithinimicrobium pekingense TaxID=384677 RepID=A0ABQ2F728_9MICO|nr:hypothetical protein GCM10011509_05690 [Ornithinimicrobium pekingense]